MHDFDFNTKGQFTIALGDQHNGNGNPSSISLSDDGNRTELLQLVTPLSANIDAFTTYDLNQPSWHINETDTQSIIDAFHYAGLFFAKLYPELHTTDITFYRERSFVTVAVGKDSFSSTYNPTKTFKNEHYGGREFPELNFRLLPDHADEFTKTLWFALNAIENYAHGQQSVHIDFENNPYYKPNTKGLDIQKRVKRLTA